MYKTIKHTYNGEEYTLCLKLANYAVNGNLAIILMDDVTFDTFDYITVNLDFKLKPYYAFIDSNTFTGIKEIIEKYHLGVSTGNFAKSGFCDYELYLFDLEKLKEYTAIDGRL